METLERRLANEGPLAAREAVRLVVRACRTVEGLHRAGTVHGRLSAAAVIVPSQRLGSARLLRPVAAADAPLWHSPLRRAEGAPSTDDDQHALALLLYAAMTAQLPDAVDWKRPPLAVFDSWDDALDQLIEAVLDPAAPERPRDVGELRARLDAWLIEEGASEEAALPWDEDSRAEDKPLDLSSLPPPPMAEPSRAGAPRGAGPPPLPALLTVLDEESTLPREDDERETVPGEEPAAPRKPKLVPPKIAQRASKRPPSAPASNGADRDDPSRSTPPPPLDRGSESAPSQPSPPPPRPRAKLVWWLVGAAAVAAAAVFFAREPATSDGGSQLEDAASAGSTTSAPVALSASSNSVSVQPSSPAPSSVPTVVATGSASSTASAAPGVSEDACVRSALPSDTFSSGWVDLSFVCGEADVVKGATRLREAIVLGGTGRPVTAGMKEWALLGFFEFAAYATVRDQCCRGAGPPEVPGSPGICKPTMKDAVFEVMQSARRGPVPTDVLAQVDKAARCILRAKQATHFGQPPKPSGGEGTALRTIVGRLTKAKR